MAALNEAQLQAKCRAKFPITVIADEDYTTMTPTQIAAEWSAYSGGTDGVYLQNVAGTWAEMDPDLPKANDRGLLVFGGGKQYGQDAFGSLVTANQAFPASWYVGWPTGLTQMPTAKGTANGLPYVEVTFSADGTTQSSWDGVSAPPGWVKIPHAEVNSGDVVIVRKMIDITAIPAQVVGVTGNLLQHTADPANAVDSVFERSTGFQIVECSLTDDGQAIDYSDNEVLALHNVGVTYASGFVFKLFPSLYTVNTAFPSHFHCLNTSTTAAATIVPEVMQRPWEYEGPWSVELEVELAPRLNGTSVYLFAGGEGWADGFGLAQDANGVYAFQRRGNVSIAGSDYIEADPGDTVKIVFYQTAQTTKVFANGASVYDGVGGREKDGSFSLGHHWSGGQHSFATFKSLVYRKGLATAAQLEEWSTLS